MTDTTSYRQLSNSLINFVAICIYNRPTDVREESFCIVSVALHQDLSL